MPTIKAVAKDLNELEKNFPKTIAYFKEKGCTGLSLNGAIITTDFGRNSNRMEPLVYEYADMFILETGLTNDQQK